MSAYVKRGMEHINTMCGVKCRFVNIKTGGICNNTGGLEV